LLRGLADEFNIFTVVGPLKQNKNLVFRVPDPLKDRQKAPDRGELTEVV
jgi:hypothetical protein